MQYPISNLKIERLIKKLAFPFPYDSADWAENLYMENYHKHSEFSNNSIADSTETMENYAARSLEYKSQCLFSGEHGSQGNWISVYKLAEQNNLKYRHSSEVYWVKDRHEKDKSNCHMVIVAKNEAGRQDLNYILSVANEDGYYVQPRIDLDLLLAVDPSNFIVTTACLAGWKYEDSEEIWAKIADHFRGNFYCEIQCHNTFPQKLLNRRILDFAKKYELPLICGLDSHYITEENKEKRADLIKDKRKSSDDEEDEKGWYMDWPDTKEVIRRLEEQQVLTEEEILLSILNTNVFINECEEITIDRHFKIPNIYHDLTYEQRCQKLKRIVQDVYKSDPVKSKAKKKGLAWEVNQYIESNTVDYPLFSREIVKLAVEKYGGVLTTTSRGSAASFLTNKYMGLTTVDRFTAEIPIYPERFLTKDRILAGSLPDVDLNVAEQGPFIRAARELLGEQGCYPLMTLSTQKESAAWKMYSRIMDVEPEKADEISKQIQQYNQKLKYTDDDEKDSVRIEEFIEEKYFPLYKSSLPYQGLILKTGVHACGFLVFDGDIRREIGIITSKNETTKERVLTACIEGQYLDEFGYVKEDFLIVDVVSLIDELFKSINQSVPSFTELKKMVDGDQKTWDVYKTGATCCINQCEKLKTTRKVQKYSPTKIAELSAFVAGIRPGFASLIGLFLNRENYSTGEPLIDELLQDSSHYMLYQESIMKVLSFLGLPMTETYNVIKSISKKKLKGAKKDHLLEELKQGWLEKFGNLDNFQNVWKVIEDAAAYSFNASHSYSMAGDSLYCAWFKAHHTSKFYEVAISHYQNKGSSKDKEKIAALVKEANQFYGYTTGSYRFGQNNTRVNVDDKTKIIYPNLSSIKGFGKKLPAALWEVWNSRNGNFKDFVDVLDSCLAHDDIGIAAIRLLIQIGYFTDYGEIYLLNKITDLYEDFRWAKIITKEKIRKKDIKEEIVKQFSEKETVKQYRGIDNLGLLNALIKAVEIKPIEISEKILNEIKIVGEPISVDPTKEKRILFVESITPAKKYSRIQCYQICSGKHITYKSWNSSSFFKSLSAGCVIQALDVTKKNKVRPATEAEQAESGRKWVPIQDSFEYWMNSASILERGTTDV